MSSYPHESGLAPALVRILQRPGRTFEIIDEISNTKPPLNAARISDALGVPRSNVSRVLNNLSKQGVTPKSMYSLKRLSVSMLSVLYVGQHQHSRMPGELLALSKSIVKTALGLLSTYFIPRSLAEEALSLVASKSPPHREALYVYAEEIVRPHPLLAETVRSLNSKVNPYLAISVAERLADDREYLSRESVRESLSLLSAEPSPKPLVKDSLDLLILSLLERDVLASKSYMDKLIKGRLARRKYTHHLLRHAVPVSSHINFRLFDPRNDMVLIFGSGGSCARDVARVLMPYLYTAGILVGGEAPITMGDWRQYDVLITLSLPPGYVSRVVSWIEGLCYWDDLKYEVVNNALKMYVRAFTLPYRMFSKTTREWVLPAAVRVV